MSFKLSNLGKEIKKIKGGKNKKMELYPPLEKMKTKSIFIELSLLCNTWRRGNRRFVRWKWPR